jgi:Asp-tRNA(Asn)/Glu-tRNA(Gln) amidotransferase A subunit family amidase
MPAPAREAAARQILDVGSADPFAAAAAAGARASAGEYIGWSGKRAFHAALFGRLFESWDILLTPTQITVAFAHDRSQPALARRVAVNGKDEPYALMFFLPSLCNLTGQPSTAFPIGLGRQSGLPVGAQAIGQVHGDRTTLGFVAALEREAGITELVPPGYES